MSKSKYVNLPRMVRVDEETHEHLTAWAERERRSVANLIGVIILKAVEADKSDQRIVIHSSDLK